MKDERITDKKARKARCASREEVLLPIPETANMLPVDYPAFLCEVKRVVATTRARAIVAANSEMTLLYWRIGRMIVEKQTEKGWGAKVIDRLSHDLKKSFPGLAGFSPRNLKYMRKFAIAWPDEEIVQRTVAQIPWRSYQAVIDDTMRHPSDAPTLGLLLVKEKNDTIVRYSLKGMRTPIGVAEWKTAIEKAMPEDMKSVLPSIEAIESEFASIDMVVEHADKGGKGGLNP